MKVLDLGGTTWAWDSAPVSPKRVVVVNLDASCLERASRWQSTLVADVCDPPIELFEEGFDLVYSNSVIEHVGGFWRRNVFADAVHKLAEHHWIQTPARYFPLEPHWLFPGFQFLPVAARARISNRWPLTPPDLRGETVHEAVQRVLQIELLSTAEIRHLFPDSTLHRERMAGMTKSIVAVR